MNLEAKEQGATDMASSPSENFPISKSTLSQATYVWQGVSQQCPCIICGKPDWCCVTRCKTLNICRRLNNGHGRRGTDKNGAEFWLYSLKGQLIPSKIFEKVATEEPGRASPEILNEVYREVLSLIYLDDQHKSALLKRGFTGNEIAARGYRTWIQEGRDDLANVLRKKFGFETCTKIPGLYVTEVRKQKWLRFAGAVGLLIPIRNHKDQIIALKIRSDQNVGNRYSYLSSVTHKGPGPGAQVHVPIWKGSLGDTVRLTEGELKAEIATMRSGMLSLSIPGVSNYRPAIPILKELSVKTVRLAFDQDSRTNPHVARALENVTNALRTEGFVVERETWDPKYKGIDDAITAGARIEVVANPSISRTQTSDWETPISLSDPKLPDFPLTALPPVLADFGKELAEFTETPVEFGAMLELAIVSTCVAKAYEIEIKPGYREPLNIWTCPALDSGNRKSAVHAECTHPLLEWQGEQTEAMAPKIREISSRRKSEEALIESLRRKLGKLIEGERDSALKEITDLEAQLTEVPKPLQLWSSDITPEKLGIVMHENRERMALLSDEGGVFDLMAGRYSGGIPNIDLILKAHAGSSERVDRGSRPPVHLQRPSLTIAISPQPSVLRSLAGTPSFRGRGLLARFLYACPRSLVGYRTGKGTPVSASTRNGYRELIRSLLNSTFESDSWDLKPLRILSLTPEALSHWASFSQELELKLREGAELFMLPDWAGKLPGAAARLAGLLHIVKYVHGSPADIPLEPDTMLSALEIADTLIPHALTIFRLMETDPEVENAKHVLRWIERGNLSHFSQREIHNALQRKFPRIEALKPALQILTERHYIRVAPREAVSHRPSVKYQVNPKRSGEQAQ